jgi:hypothetical protein
MEIVTKQFPIDDASKQTLIDIRISIFGDDSAGLAEKVFTGDISVGQFEESMKKLIRELHSSVAAIGKGGWNEMTWQDWGRLGPQLKEQYRYLHGFAEYITANKDTVSLEYLKARAGMYGNATHSAIMMAVGIEISKMLPWLPGDLSTECGGNCKCRWLLSIIGTSETTNTVQAVWRLTPAEHCETCATRNGHTVMFELDKSIPVPEMIGFR